MAGVSHTSRLRSLTDTSDNVAMQPPSNIFLHLIIICIHFMAKLSGQWCGSCGISLSIATSTAPIHISACLLEIK